MSSPRVVTFEHMPMEEARRANREGTAHYLALARDLFEQTLRLEGQALEAGGQPGIVRPPLTYEEAQAKAWSLIHSGPTGCGEAAVEFAHAYWQSLKHPWHEEVLRNYAQAQAVVAAAREREAARIEALAQSLSVELRTQATLTEVTLTDAQASYDPQARVEQTIAAILAAAAPDDIKTLAQSIAETQNIEITQRLIALEILRSQVAADAVARRRDQVLQFMKEQERRAVRERMVFMLDRCTRQLEGVEAPGIDQLQVALTAVRARIEKGDVAAEDEEQLAELERQALRVARGQTLVQAAVAELKRMGYSVVDVIERAGPAEVTSVYLAHRTDEERLALLQVSDREQMLSAEVVREGRASVDRTADKTAQERLCKAMKIIETELASRWSINAVSDTPPGATPRVVTALRRRAKREQTALEADLPASRGMSRD